MKKLNLLVLQRKKYRFFAISESPKNERFYYNSVGNIKKFGKLTSIEDDNESTNSVNFVRFLSKFFVEDVLAKKENQRYRIHKVENLYTYTKPTIPMTMHKVPI
jgi:hypothetical protein